MAEAGAEGWAGGGPGGGAEGGGELAESEGVPPVGQEQEQLRHLRVESVRPRHFPS